MGPGTSLTWPASSRAAVRRGHWPQCSPAAARRSARSGAPRPPGGMHQNVLPRGAVRGASSLHGGGSGHRRSARQLALPIRRYALGVFELTWAPDGRATFSYGEVHIAGKAHVIWRRSHVRTGQDPLARHWKRTALCRGPAQVTQVFGTFRPGYLLVRFRRATRPGRIGDVTQRSRFEYSYIT